MILKVALIILDLLVLACSLLQKLFLSLLQQDNLVSDVKGFSGLNRGLL